ncbi:MAG: hypothetical protein Fur002_02920 [Anaerolineales bacterium]
MKSFLGLSIVLIFFLSAVPYAWMGLYAWRKRPAVAVTPFAWMMLCLSVWSLMYGLELSFNSLANKIVAASVGYLASITLPIFLLFFALEFTGKSHWLTLHRRAAAGLLIVLAALLFWTNEAHGWMWRITRLYRIDGVTLLDVEYKPLFWAFALVLFAADAAALALLLMDTLKRPDRHKALLMAIVLSAAAPAVSLFLFLLDIHLVTHLDFTPLLALPASAGFSWAVTQRYRLMELLPPEYLTMLQNMPDGVIITNGNQRVIYLNPIAENLLGRSQTEAMGQPLFYVSSLYGEKITPYLSGGEQRANIRIGEGRHAKEFDLTVSPVTSLNRVENISHFDRLIVLHDITQLKQAENAISRRESVMSALSLAAQQLLKETAWEHNIPAVLEKIGQAADLSHIHVAMNYSDEERKTHTSLCYEWASVHAQPQLSNPALQHVSMRAAGLERWEKNLAAGMPLVGAVKTFPEVEQRFLSQIKTQSLAVMPIFVHQQWWGFIVFDDCRSERQWTNTEIEALSIAANMFGSAEERARAEQKLRRRQDSLDLLHKIVLASLQAEDLQLMSQALVKLFPNLIQADGCALSLWNETARQEELLAFYDRQKRQPPAQTLAEYALQAKHAIVLEHAAPAFFEERGLVQPLPCGALIVLPLRAGEKKIGAVTLWFDHPRRFQAEEVAISEQASYVVALALEKFQTVEEAQRRALTSETLRKASAAISSTLETDEAIARILEQLKQVIPYDSASVQLLRGNHLEIVGGSGFADPKAVLGMSFSLTDENPNSVVIKTGKPHRLGEARKFYDAFNYPPHNHIRSWMGVPLVYEGRIIGLLAIDSAQPNRFMDEEEELAAMFAKQVAVTLENARVFEETQNQAITDPLTGAYNRRGMLQMGEFELARARRANRPLSVLMFDIDHFKRVNDRYGHLAGDQVLRGLAEVCRQRSRSIDVLCRYGGEEFVILLPGTPLEAAKNFAERLRQNVERAPLATDEGPLRVTISLGVAQLKDNNDLKTLIEYADRALYAAKRGGRNRVEAYGETP